VTSGGGGKLEGVGNSDRRGIRSSLAALAQAFAFIGLMLAGTVLLIVTAAPVVVAVLGLGHLVQDLLRGSAAADGQDLTYLLGALIGAACGWLVLPAALLTGRRYASHTRRLSARWCGVARTGGQASAGAPTSSG
jgi:hypothetical protein